MKKILTFVLVFALIMSMSVTAFAAGTEGSEIVTNEENGVVSETLTDDNAKIDAWGLYDADGDGKAEGEEEDNSTDVIYVNIAWDAMNWIYSAGSYDAENMKNVDAQWISDEKTITVTNQSNVSITATPSYDDDGVENTDLTLGEALTLAAATPATEGEDKGTATTGTISVDIDTSSAAITADSKIGTITVTIAKTA